MVLILLVIDPSTIDMFLKVLSVRVFSVAERTDFAHLALSQDVRARTTSPPMQRGLYLHR